MACDPRQAAIRMLTHLSNRYSDGTFDIQPNGDFHNGGDEPFISSEHIIWMLNGISDKYIKGEKAHRWLGFTQGVLTKQGHFTDEELQRINNTD